MMVAKSYYNTAQFVECFNSLDDLRANGETCDIRLLASNKEISAHKLILVSVSEYFKNAIYGLFLNDSGKGELELKEIQYEILSVVVNYIYSGKIDINSENVFEIYNAADYCLMNLLKEMCIDFLHENLDIENCVKIWVMANNCKQEKLTTAAGNYIFSNLSLLSNMNHFLNLSSEEFLNLFNLWPKHELFDSIITAALNWAADKDNCEETIINILRDIPHTTISDDYLDNFLSTNEFIQNNITCNKWLMNIYKEKSKLHKMKQAETVTKLKSEIDDLKLKQTEIEAKLKAAESETELKFSTFLYNEPIIFMNESDGQSNNFYKYNRRDDAFDFYNKTRCGYSSAYDCTTYKNYIYVLRNSGCERFEFNDLNQNRYETVIDHNRGEGSRVAVCNDSMYIVGGSKLLSCIDLNTSQDTSFNLLHDRKRSGIAVSDGAIYICGGYRTNIVERFDPREGTSIDLGEIPFTDNCNNFCSAATLSNQIYCTDGYQNKMLDLRNNIWTDIKSVRETAKCLVSSNGKMHAITAETIYEYNDAFKKWHALASFPELSKVVAATSFE